MRILTSIFLAVVFEFSSLAGRLARAPVTQESGIPQSTINRNHQPCNQTANGENTAGAFRGILAEVWSSLLRMTAHVAPFFSTKIPPKMPVTGPGMSRFPPKFHQFSRPKCH